uniref:ATP-binding protein n=1 Tax=Flavobacterium sp. TaxID=239 RepID=UPI00374D20F0
TKLQAHQLEYITTVNQSANILMEVVNDILDFSKIETGKLELDYQKVNLYELANQIIDIIRFDSEQKNISLNLIIDSEVPNYVFIDALRLKQILLNLLSNAVKFTIKGKVELHIVAESKTETNINLKFSVIDSGVGIKKDNHKKIFEPFSQEDNSTTRNYGGTGLGLTISNNILGLMSSKLELISGIKKGSNFYFNLNLAYYENQDINDVNDFEVEFEDVTQYYKAEVFSLVKKVLIVEDNKINMLLARTLIKKILPNAIISEALNGRLGIEKYLEVKPDIILLDIQMPVLNGYETAQEIRMTDFKIPIIALTAGTIKGEKEKCLDAGMNDYISKPIIKEVFENMLLKWLQ